jgi:hypothetical protein
MCTSADIDHCQQYRQTVHEAEIQASNYPPTVQCRFNSPADGMHKPRIAVLAP